MGRYRLWKNRLHERIFFMISESCHSRQTIVLGMIVESLREGASRIKQDSLLEDYHRTTKWGIKKAISNNHEITRLS
jgi:hypothetical protein